MHEPWAYLRNYLVNGLLKTKSNFYYRSHGSSKDSFGAIIALRWRHNERDGVLIHQTHRVFTQAFIRAQIKENIKAQRHWLCEENSPVTSEFPTQRASNAENASIWWRHQGYIYNTNSNCATNLWYWYLHTLSVVKFTRHVFAVEGIRTGKNNHLLRIWWRHQMETFSALLALCVGNSPVTGEFPTQRPVTPSFDVFFDLCLNSSMNDWLNNREAGDLRRHRAHYDVIVMKTKDVIINQCPIPS